MERPHFPCRIDAAISPRTLADRRITHIVSVGSEPIPADNPASGIRHLRIRVEDVDYADLLIHLPLACRFIHEAINAGGTVLVHCVQGLSRSATVVAAYRAYYSAIGLRLHTKFYSSVVMYSRRIEASEAMEIVRRGNRVRSLYYRTRLTDLQLASKFGSSLASRYGFTTTVMTMHLTEITGTACSLRPLSIQPIPERRHIRQVASEDRPLPSATGQLPSLIPSY